MGGEVMGLGSVILSTECDFPTGRIIQDWHRAFHTSTVSKKGIKLWAVQCWSSPRAGAALGAPFPPRFWPVRLGRVVGCCLGSTPPSGTSPVCGCWKAGTCTFPCHDFRSSLLFTDSLLLPSGPPGYLKLLLLLLQISLVVGVNVGIHNVFYQLHKLIMWILCNLEHYQRMNQWCTVLSSLNSQK